MLPVLADLNLPALTRVGDDGFDTDCLVVLSDVLLVILTFSLIQCNNCLKLRSGSDCCLVYEGW